MVTVRETKRREGRAICHYERERGKEGSGVDTCCLTTTEQAINVQAESLTHKSPPKNSGGRKTTLPKSFVMSNRTGFLARHRTQPELRKTQQVVKESAPSELSSKPSQTLIARTSKQESPISEEEINLGTREQGLKKEVLLLINFPF